MKKYNYPKDKYPKEKVKNSLSLCWWCENIFDGCNHTRDKTPVDGWCALKQKVKSQYNNNNGHEYIYINDTYFVISCPEFIKAKNDKINFFEMEVGGEEFLVYSMADISNNKPVVRYHVVCKSNKWAYGQSYFPDYAVEKALTMKKALEENAE